MVTTFDTIMTISIELQSSTGRLQRCRQSRPVSHQTARTDTPHPTHPRLKAVYLIQSKPRPLRCRAVHLSDIRCASCVVRQLLFFASFEGFLVLNLSPQSGSGVFIFCYYRPESLQTTYHTAACLHRGKRLSFKLIDAAVCAHCATFASLLIVSLAVQIIVLCFFVCNCIMLHLCS